MVVEKTDYGSFSESSSAPSIQVITTTIEHPIPTGIPQATTFQPTSPGSGSLQDLPTGNNRTTQGGGGISGTRARSRNTRPRNLEDRGESSLSLSISGGGIISRRNSDPDFEPETDTHTEGTPSLLTVTAYNLTTPMSSTSSGDFHQRQPLLQQSNGGWADDSNPEDNELPKESKRNGSAAVRIDIPPPLNRSESEQSNQKRFPKEKGKTVLAFVWLAFNFTLATVSLALTHERLPDPKTVLPLPDIVLDNITAQDWALDVSEILIMVSTASAVLVIVMHRHRWIVGRRAFFILGILYMMRSLTMFVTVLPVASFTYQCAPKANTTSILVIAKRAFQLMSGFGLSINGNHVYCGDYMYSGHTVILVSAYLLIQEYTSRRLVILHWISWLVSLTGIVMVLIARGHYTVDVLVAYYVTTRLFWMYHTMANNIFLKNSSTTNYLARLWWFRVFQYLEGNVGGPLPRLYGFQSIPFFTKFRSRRNSRI